MSVQVNVVQTFVDSLISATEEIVDFPLEYRKGSIKILDTEEIHIQSEGIFASKMCFQLEHSLVEEILKRMLKHKKLTSDICDLYLGEYINILSGHALTRINNIVGKSSRLTVPIVGAGAIKEKIYKQNCVIAFTSEYGDMLLHINYEWNEYL